MQALKITYMVVIKNYDNNGWKHELDETNTFVVIFSLNLRTPFCTSIFTLKNY